jgi:dTDP-4-dehydrorhamnose reductase
MEQPRALVIGKNGQVGWELRRILGPIAQVVALDYPEIDFSREEALRQCVREVRPTVILNAAAYTAVDKAETEEPLCRQINATAPRILAEEAKRAKALLVHYSTDYVYDGIKAGAYVETDAANPASVYGRTKWAGDQAVMSAGCDYLIFRLCWVYGARGKNFLLTIQRLAREKETLRVVRDQVGAPTWSRMIAEATAFAVRRVWATQDRSAFNGVYHLSATGQTSWHGFAEAIVKRMPEAERKCRVIEPIGTNDFPTAARRPANSVMDTAKLQKTFGIRLPDWEESLGLVTETEEPGWTLRQIFVAAGQPRLQSRAMEPDKQ